MRIQHHANGDFTVVYEPSDPQPGKVERLPRPEDPAMSAEFERRCKANAQGHTGDIVAGR